MKTWTDFEELNFEELSFFSGELIEDCKWEIAARLGIKELTKMRTLPKVTLNHKVSVATLRSSKNSRFNMRIRSNSYLDGQDRIKYLCEYYNEGTNLDELREFAEHPGYAKAGKFKGRYSVLNDILNRQQYELLKKAWELKRKYTPESIF